MTLQAKCDSITKRIESKETTPGLWKDSAIHDYRFTLNFNEKVIGNLTLHIAEADAYEVGKTYPFAVG